LASHLRERYLKLADSAFRLIEPVLQVESGLPVALQGIGEPELQEVDCWRRHPACRVEWDWRKILREFRKKPKRMDVSFYVNQRLCGLMIATISKARVNINVAYVEACPDPAHPLKERFLGVALLQAKLIAAVIDATHVSVSKPDHNVVPLYEGLGYQMLSSDRARLRRGGRPRYELLVKAIR